jgi:hypothetical protein
MAEDQDGPAFEARLGRLFAETPTFNDAELFTLRVGDRLNRGRTARGLIIGALGFVGGGVVVAQAAADGVITRLQSLPNHSTAAIGRALDHILPWRVSISGPPFAAELIWIPLTLAGLAIGLAVVRAIGEI